MIRWAVAASEVDRPMQDQVQFYCNTRRTPGSAQRVSSSFWPRPICINKSSRDDPPEFVIEMLDTKRIFAGLEVRKAAGPDNITLRLLMLFNWSLRLSVAPGIFKRSVIIPIPKKSTVTCLNDYRPVALSSVIAKSFVRLILNFLNSRLPRLWILTISLIVETGQQRTQSSWLYIASSHTWTLKAAPTCACSSSISARHLIRSCPKNCSWYILH